MGKTSISKRILCFLIALPGVFLLTNNYPILAVSSILVVLFLGLIFLFYKGSINPEHRDVLRVLAIIYIYFIFSYFISNQSLKNFISFKFLRYDGSFFFCYILFFALAVPYFNYKKVADYYFKILFAIFSTAALFGIFGYLTKYIPALFKYEGASYGDTFTVFNFAHNATGSVFSVVCIFLLVFILKETKKGYRIMLICLFILCLAGLLITKSRGSYISFAVGAMVALWLHFRSLKKFLLTSFAILIASLPIIYITEAYKRIMMIFDFKEANISWRFILWERALNMFRQSPFFGIGLGRFNDVHFLPVYNNKYDFGNFNIFVGFPKIISFFMEPNFDFSNAHAHNSYLQYLAETGFLGLGLLLFFWILCFRKILKGYININDPFSKKVFLSSLGAMSALFVLALTENYFSATTVMMCVSMVTSLSLGLYWQEKNRIVI
jgi:O-antigen ligase